MATDDKKRYEGEISTTKEYQIPLREEENKDLPLPLSEE